MKLSRREFVAGTLLGTAALPPASRAETAAGTAGPLKVCVFADIHFRPGMFPHDNLEHLAKIVARARQEGCAFIIHLGDLVHNARLPETKAYIRAYNACGLPAYHVVGNHDQDESSWAELRDAFGLAKGYYSIDRGGFRFVVLDPNYYTDRAGKAYHFENKNYWKRPKDGVINFIPPDQLAWLRQTVMESPYPCCVLSHQSLELPYASSGVANKDAVQAIFNEANAKVRGRVRVVMNGHMHTDNYRILDNILYWDVNSASNFWYPKAHDCFPDDYVKTHRGATHTLAWQEPLSAILTLWPNGRIQVKGSRSDWLYGATPARAGEYDVDPLTTRVIAPVIRNLDLTLPV